MKYLVFVSSLIVFFLSGCVEKKIVDDVNVVTMVCFDKRDGEEEYKATALIPQYLKDQPVTDQKLTEKSILSREILNKMQRESSNPLVIGKMQLVLFSEELAKQGISDVVDPLQRDESIGSRIILAVSRGEASEIVSEQLGSKGTATYLASLILHNKKQRDLPMTNLHLFLNRYYSRLEDPFLPILKKEKDGTITIDGVALFDQDKLVGEVPNEQLFPLKILTDGHTDGNYMLRIPKLDELVSIRSISSSKKVYIKQLNPLKIVVDVELKGFLRQYTGGSVTMPKIHEIEKALEKKTKKEIIALFDHFKELHVDPVGLGVELKAKSRKFDASKWKDRKGDYSVEVRVNATIPEIGVTK